MASIIYTIPDELLPEFKKGFLKSCPVFIEEGELPMSENQWIKEWGKRQFLRAYRKGIKQLAEGRVKYKEDLVG